MAKLSPDKAAAIEQLESMADEYGDDIRELADAIGKEAALQFIMAELFGSALKLETGREIPRSAISASGSKRIVQ
jgi:hypothetical protein